MALTKGNLIASLYKNTDLQKIRSRQLVETAFELIKSNLASGEDVMISLFGKFEVRDKGSRRGRNPQTGERLILQGG